ncbi:hypothetical protein GCM10027456_78530 [Kineosporia babensis]
MVGGDLLGIASTGAGSTNVQYTGANPVVLPEAAFVAVENVPAPPGLSNVPTLRRGFVGRQDALQALDAAFAGTSPSAASFLEAPGAAPGEVTSSGTAGVRAVLVQAVHGLGGIVRARWPRTGPPPAPARTGQCQGRSGGSAPRAQAGYTRLWPS